MSDLAKIMGRVAVPLVTPFHSDTEDVNFEALEQLIEFVIENNHCDSLVLTGTTGEFHSLSDEERIEVWRIAKNAASGRVPLVASSGAASTRTTVKLCVEAEKLGFDALMVIVPYYAKTTQIGIEQHFREVSAAVSLPILVYNIPLFTGINIEPDTLARLAALENIQGIKEEAGIQPIQATRFALQTSQDFSIYCGDDTMVLQVLPQRGVGVVSGGSHVIGHHMKRMIAAYFANDNSLASEYYFKLAPFFNALGQNGRINPIPVLRGAIEMASGIPIGPPRRPLVEATQQELEVVRPILEALQVFDAAKV